MRSLALFSIWILIFTIPWENMIMVPGIGTVSRTVGFPVLAIAVLATLYSQKIRVHFIHGLMLVFWIWTSFTYFWTVDTELTEIIIFSFAQILVMVWLVFQWAQRLEDVNRLLTAYVLGCCVSIGATFYSYTMNVMVVYQRYAASGFDANDLAVTLALGIPVAWYLSLGAQKQTTMWLYRLYLPAAMFAIFLTASRAGFLVALVGLSYVLWTYRDLSANNKALFPFFGMVALFIVAPYIPLESLERIQTIGNAVSTGDLNSRTIIWQAGLDGFLNNTYGGDRILWGVGAGAYLPAIAPFLGGDGQVAHNVYLSILVEQGVIGLLLFFAVLGKSWLDTLQMPRRERLLWQVTMLIWAIAAMSLTWEYRKATWLIIALLIAHSAALMRVKRQDSATLQKPE